MIKETTLQLGGEEKKVRFGVMGFYEDVGDVYHGDPLDLLRGPISPKSQFEIIYAIIYAGLIAAGNKIEKELLHSHVRELDFETANEVLNLFSAAYAGKNGKPGETQAQMLVEESQ